MGGEKGEENGKEPKTPKQASDGDVLSFHSLNKDVSTLLDEIENQSLKRP